MRYSILEPDGDGFTADMQSRGVMDVREEQQNKLPSGIAIKTQPCFDAAEAWIR